MESRSRSEFQLLTKEINILQKEITYQTNIRKHQTIPLKFLPRHYPTTPDNSMTNKFKQELKGIFWKHLDDTIRSNIVTLEIKKPASKTYLTPPHKPNALLLRIQLLIHISHRPTPMKGNEKAQTPPRTVLNTQTLMIVF